MGRQEQPIDPRGGEVARFAAELRELRSSSGNPSYRELEAKVHYSRTTLARATAGQVLPSLEVTLALATSLGGDLVYWRRRWQEVRGALDLHAGDVPRFDSGVAPALPPQPLRDGSDPEAAGCASGAVTVHARKVPIRGTQRILGHVELRYAASARAAWSRFVGYNSLNHLAHRRSAEVLVEVVRPADGATAGYRDEYMFDVHWSDLLLTGGRAMQAKVAVYFDGELVADGATDVVTLD